MKTKLKHLFSIALLVISSYCHGQSWEFIYDSIPTMGRHVILTKDSNYLVTGVNNGFEDDNLSFKLDCDGNIIWMSPNGGYAVTQTYDNKYVFAGCNSYHSVLKKIDENGNLEWYKTYGADEEYYAVIESTDSSLVACGVKYNDGDSTFLVSKTDSDGNLIWTTRFYSMYHNGFRDIIEFDHNYYLVGRDYDDNYPPFYLFIAKVTMAGASRWQKIYEMGSTGKSIALTHDSAFIVAGGNLLTKFNTDGDTIWTKKLNTSCQFESIAVTPDNSFILSGTDPYPYHANVLTELDSTGNRIWVKHYPSIYTAYWGSFESVQCTNEGGYIACGYSVYTSQHITRLRVIKTDGTGNIIVGTGNEPEINQFLIYPNPGNGKFNIKIPQIESIEVFDVNGRMVNAICGPEEIDLSTCQTGIYFLRIYTQQGIYSQKVIIK
jgi:Secretion system C-terminal sorting domain